MSGRQMSNSDDQTSAQMDSASGALPSFVQDPTGRPVSNLLPVTQPGDRPFTEPAATASFYDQVGGHETFVRLVDVFYAGVAEDEVMTAMYPEDDLGPAKVRLRMFLEQYWGGPKTYSETRGHPRLRMRHVPYQVTPAARDRWLMHMRAAVDAVALPPLHEATLWDYLERAAHSMVNSA